MSVFLWILFSTLYLVALISFGARTLRNGHYVMFVLGLVFPVLWLVGGLIAPAPRVTTAA